MAADLAFGLLFIGGTIAVVLGVYFLGRRITRNWAAEEWSSQAKLMISLVSGLHVLILALVFAQELIVYTELETETAREANAVADVYFDSARYGEIARVKIQEPLREYVRLILSTEWPNLGTVKRLPAETWSKWDDVYQAILDLEPQGARQTSLRDHMLEQIQSVAEFRVGRESHAADSMTPLFWAAAVMGVVFIAIGFHIYRPNRHSLTMLSIFAAYTGIVLYFIYAFSNPYSPPARFEPGAFERLQEQMRLDIAGG